MITGTLTAVYETENPTDPNFPIPPGYNYYYTSYGNGFRTFDFGRNVYYALVNNGSTIGIVITDLSTMLVTRTATLATMYAGTSYGSPPGTPRTGSVWDIITGNNTDIYLLVSSDKAHQYFVRVDAVTLKVTGELFGFGGHDLQDGTANKTTNHTIVGYRTHPAYHLGLLIMDGTGMAAVGTATAPVYSSYQTIYIPAATHVDGSCDFIMIDSDLGSTSGTSSSGLTNTVYDPNSGTDSWIGQVNYDAAHDAIVFWLQNRVNGPPTWLTSVNWDGSVNWTTYLDIGSAAAPGNRGQSQLTGDTLMTGSYNTPLILDTGTGDVIYTGALTGTFTHYYFEVWDASRSAWWVYDLSGHGFTRIDFTETLKLAMDNVILEVSGAAPCELCLDWSDDRGHTFGTPVCQPMNSWGYLTSLQWQRLGMARDRVFRLTWTCAEPTVLQGGWVTAIVGDEDNEMAGQGSR